MNGKQTDLLEIEHKFLVCAEWKSWAEHSKHYVQGYLCSEPERTVRVRLSGDSAWLTIKGPSSADGLSRFEFEKTITPEEAQQLLKLCLPGVIEKQRYIVPYHGFNWEVDEFFGDNEGLVMAEIEVATKEETFDLPPFIGQEVTGDKRYYNSQLIKNPYKNWGNI